MSKANAKESIVPVRHFPGVTVGKKYPIITRENNRCIFLDDNFNTVQWYLVPGEFELVEENEEVHKTVRKMKFSNKPGSAVVTYDTGDTFHITRLTSVEVFKNDDDVLIDVTRTYIKDGLLFQERVGIPVHKFVKIVWISPAKDDVLEQEVTITYDKEAESLKYAMTYLADALDFTSAVEFIV